MCEAELEVEGVEVELDRVGQAWSIGKGRDVTLVVEQVEESGGRGWYRCEQAGQS